jgi:hypothetical protein
VNLLRWFRRNPGLRLDDPPTDVRLIRTDGTVIPCDVIRDPDGDRDGLTYWVAVPQVPDLLIDEGDRLEAMLPPHSGLGWRFHARKPPPGCRPALRIHIPREDD